MGDWDDQHGAPATDGGSEGGADAADAGTTCPGAQQLDANAFCDTFDERDVVDFGWPTATTTNKGVLALSRAQFASAPQSLRAEAQEQGTAYLRRRIVPKKRFTYEARFFVETWDDAGAYFFQQNFALANGNAGLRFAVYPDAVQLGQAIRIDGQNERNLNETLRKKFTQGKWSRIVLDVELGAPSTVSVTLDGDKLLERFVLDAVFGPVPIDSDTGITYARSADAGVRWSIHVDDVSIRWE